MKSNRNPLTASVPPSAAPKTALRSFLALTLATALYVFGIAHGVACNPAKDARFAVDLIHCIDEHVDLAPEQAAAVCGVQAVPDFINLFQERRAAKITSKPCTVITVDAGPPVGPGK